MNGRPVPMNRKERRAAGTPKLAPENATFTLALYRRNEVDEPDGTVVVQCLFQLIAPNGRPLTESTERGDIPILIASVPVPIGRKLLTTASTPRLVVAR